MAVPEEPPPEPGPGDAWLRPAPESGRAPPKAPEGPGNTVFQPQPGTGGESAGADSNQAREFPPPPIEAGPAFSPQEHPSSRMAAPSRGQGQLPIGTMLNHIYRIDRLIACDGMGELYEGTNVSHAEERVAIKVIPQHLAADPNVQALFRTEARTLTKLAHPGLVRYRLLAFEPQLHLLYIVSEFVDGPALSEVLSSIYVSPAGLAQFVRRLAAALAAAHALGKIHRDMSPDCILLPGSRIEDAKIIDFAIAGDLAAAQGKTFVGDGVSGYAAPEQFDDASGVGPWTDVYSLGLVALAVALRRAPDMGITFAEAVEKRKRVPDLSAVAPPLRPVFVRMLQPDSARRYRSMTDVVAAIDQLARLQPLSSVVKSDADFSRKRSATARSRPKNRGRYALAAIALLVVAAAIWVGALVWVSPSSPPVAPAPTPKETVVPRAATAVIRAAVDPDRVRQAIEATLPTVGCSWLDAEEFVPKLTLSGVAGDSSAVAKTVSDALARQGLNVPVDVGNLFAVNASACGVLDAVRAFRAPGGDSAIKSSQPDFHLQTASQNCTGSAIPQAEIVMSFVLPEQGDDFALLGMDDAGKMQSVVGSRSDFLGLMAKKTPGWEDLGSGRYRLTVCMGADSARPSPVSALLLLAGRGPFRLGLPADGQIAASDSWIKRFEARARAGAWTTQMAWIRVDTN